MLDGPAGGGELGDGSRHGAIIIVVGHNYKGLFMAFLGQKLIFGELLGSGEVLQFFETGLVGAKTSDGGLEKEDGHCHGDRDRDWWGWWGWWGKGEHIIPEKEKR